MRKFNTLLAAGALAATFGLTACGSGDDANDSSTSAAATQQSSEQGSAAAGSSAAPSDGGGQSSTSVTEVVPTAAPKGGVQSCTLKRKGQDVKASVAGISCEDATAVWDKFPNKDEDMSTGNVTYKGETFMCSIMAQGATLVGGCTAGQKVISIGNV